MNIGRKIKELRKERGITQEKLADYLGISYQAVSKWENETALPDITLVVPLANFFGIGTDELFSLNQQINDEKTAEYQKKYNELFNIGDLQSAIDLMRKALAEYPKNYRFMMNLVYALPNTKNTDYSKPEVKNEIIALCERVLEDCTEDMTRHNAIQQLCFIYPQVGQREKAIELARKMPNIDVCFNTLITHIFTTDSIDYQRAVQQNIQCHIGYACNNLIALSTNTNKNIGEQILCVNTAIELLKTIYYDQNFGFYHNFIYGYYYNLAKLYMEKNETEKAVVNLLLSEKHAAAADEIFDIEVPYTSIFADKVTHSPKNTMKNYTETVSQLLGAMVKQEIFAPLSENPDFKALKQRLCG